MMDEIYLTLKKMFSKYSSKYDTAISFAQDSQIQSVISKDKFPYWDFIERRKSAYNSYTKL